MKADIEIIILPYDAADEDSLLRRLVAELTNGSWTRFRAAVAFAKFSGNFKQLLSALNAFATAGNSVQLTFGADIFGANTKGTDFEAIEVLLSELGTVPKVDIFLYHEKGRTFHPKIYLFDSEAARQARVIIGSSNWSKGGMMTNVEVDAVINLDLANEEHQASYLRIVECFRTYWSEQ